MPEVDTVGENYYVPLARAEAASGVLFWVVSALSLATLLVDKAQAPRAYEVLQIAFLVCALFFFALGLGQKLYWFPRAEDARRQELLSNSYRVALTHETTVGYYNNDQTHPLKRLAASVMESAFFTSRIARLMLVGERSKTLGYLGIYLVALANRSTNLELIAVAAQVLFSEDILSRWLRLEWLRMRSEQVFDKFNRLFAAQPPFSKAAAQSQTLDLFSFYETTKSGAAVLLSSKAFKRHNPSLSMEWDKIRERTGI